MARWLAVLMLLTLRSWVGVRRPVRATISGVVSTPSIHSAAVKLVGPHQP